MASFDASGHGRGFGLGLRLFEEQRSFRHKLSRRLFAVDRFHVGGFERRMSNQLKKVLFNFFSFAKTVFGHFFDKIEKHNGLTIFLVIPLLLILHLSRNTRS